MARIGQKYPKVGRQKIRNSEIFNENKKKKTEKARTKREREKTSQKSEPKKYHGKSEKIKDKQCKKYKKFGPILKKINF